MVKPVDEVISEWNELVNMTAAELKEWLGSEESVGAGWSKDDGSGETIGHESGRKIIKILESNPEKDPDKYDEDDVAHMRKVRDCGWYWRRHVMGWSMASKKG